MMTKEERKNKGKGKKRNEQLFPTMRKKRNREKNINFQKRQAREELKVA